MTDLNKLAAELHADAVARGFWDVNDALMKHVVKMHSELSEAVQEDRCGRPMLYVDDIEVCECITDISKLDGRKPEGIATELGDFVMMTLDMLVESGVNIELIAKECRESYRSDHYVALMNTDLVTFILALHRQLSALCDAGRNKETCAETVLNSAIVFIFGVEFWLEQRGINLWDVIRLKMDYNKNRPKLHGRKY